MSDDRYGGGRLRPRPRRRRRGGRALRVAAAAVALGAAFALGLALGRALEDGPRDRGSVTYVRTLRPLPQQPVPTG